MTRVLAVGSVALDTVETPFGAVTDAPGGSATFFAAAAAHFAPVSIVGVVGSDYPAEALDFLRNQGIDLSGVERADGESFRWGGKYGFDLNTRETLFTELGVFADFQPRIPAELRQARWVFLGNIDPVLQLNVLDQVESPEFVACDTMNYWIDGSREALMRLLQRVDFLILNDEEARQLSEEPNLAKAAAWIRRHGPEYVVIKKGEHGAVLFTEGHVFFAPGYPLEVIVDPTGAGDAFAGGMVGHLARTESIDATEMRRAIVFGCAMGSFACEAFGPERFASLTEEEIVARVTAFREMTAFEHEIPTAI